MKAYALKKGNKYYQLDEYYDSWGGLLGAAFYSSKKTLINEISIEEAQGEKIVKVEIKEVME